MKRSDNIARSQLKIGVFVIAAVILFALGVLMMGERTKMFVPKGRISLIMSNIAGLKEGAPVWLSGVDIGVVRTIRFEDPERSNAVEITLQVEKEALHKIGRDSVITIKTRGLMGEKYVDITPSAHFVKAPLTKVYGTDLPKLDDVMKKASTAFDNLNSIMDKIANGQGSMGKLVADPKLYNNLSLLTSELNSFVTTANAGQGTLGKLNRSSEVYDRLLSALERADQTLAKIQYSDGTLNKLINDRELYDKLIDLADKSRDTVGDIHELNRKLSSPTGTIGKMIEDREFYDKGIALIEQTDRSMQTLQEVMKRVRDGEGTAGKLVNEQVLYDKMNTAVDALNLLLQDIQRHPRRYFKFSIF